MANTTLTLSKNGVSLYDYDGTPWSYNANLTLYEFAPGVEFTPATTWLQSKPIAFGTGTYSSIAKSWNVSLTTSNVSGFYVLRAVSLDFTRSALWFDPVDWKNYQDTGGNITMVFNTANLRDAYSGVVESRPSFDMPLTAVPEPSRYDLLLWALAVFAVASRWGWAKNPHKTR